MSDIMLGVGLTACSTLLILIFERQVVDPIQELRKKLAGVKAVLIFYANIYMDPNKSDEGPYHIEESKEIRGMATDLIEAAHVVPCYFIMEKLPIGVPTQKEIGIISSALIGLSNSLWGPHPESLAEHNSERRNKINAVLSKYIGTILENE